MCPFTGFLLLLIHWQGSSGTLKSVHLLHNIYLSGLGPQT